MQDKIHSIDIWENLANDLDSAGLSDAEDGIWSQVSIKPGGLWKEASDETILVRPGSIVEQGIWQQSSEETVILPRHRPDNIWASLDEQADDTFILDSIKNDIWRELEDETQILHRPKVVLWQSPKIRDMGKYRPMRAVGWALKQIESSKGETYWVLKNLRKEAYLRLNEEQVFLWELMDGSHSIQDMAVSVFFKYKTLSFEGLMGYVENLYANGFLISEKVDIYQSVGQRLGRYHPLYWLKRIGQFLLQTEFSLKGVDQFYTNAYQWGARLLYTRVAILLMSLICLIGIPTFFYITLQGQYSFLQGGSDSLGMGLVGIFITQTIAILVHESGHALTTKHYGRTIRRGGVGLYMGMLVFFIDTTDIWMEPRKPRLAVTWAGPFTGFVLGGLASLILLVMPTSTGAGIAYQFATLCFGLSIINLNPLLKLDGYFLLMDWLEMPLLRERSFSFVRDELLSKLKKREVLSSEERIYSIFGILSAAWTVIFVFVLIQLYGGKLISYFQGL